MKQETKERNKKVRTRYKELKKLNIKVKDIIPMLENEYFLSYSQIIHILYSRRMRAKEDGYNIVYN